MAERVAQVEAVDPASLLSAESRPIGKGRKVSLRKDTIHFKLTHHRTRRVPHPCAHLAWAGNQASHPIPHIPASTSPCYTCPALENMTQAPRADDSQWIRVWPETASALYPTHRLPYKRWLLWLAGSSQELASPCSSSAYKAKSQAMLKSGIHALRAPAPICVTAFIRSLSSPLSKETLVYPHS